LSRNAEVAGALLTLASMKRPDVLVVDDEVDIRETMRAVLEAEGYRVATAADGREALDKLKREPPPKLVLLDLTMPVMNGYELLEEMKNDVELASIPVTVVSAICDLKPPRVPYLKKPFDVDVLTRSVARSLKKVPS
jgi:two-component system response regulator CpxR